MLKYKKSNVSFVRQYDLMDCGPASLSMITSYFGNMFSLHSLRQLCQIGKDGVSLLGIMYAAKKIGLDTFSVKLDINQLVKEFNAPCILFWNKNHFLVLESIKNPNKEKKRFYIADPAHGKVILSEKDFKKAWLSGNKLGVALFLKPTEKFYSINDRNKFKERMNHIFTLFLPYKKKILTLIVFVLIGSVLNIALPFLTEALIDDGVEKKDINYVGLILLSQLFVFLGIILVTVLRNWFTLVVGAKFSIDIIYSYLDKVLKLPMSFFDTKNSGDFNQRIQDNAKIEEFFTSDSILTFFSILTLIVYSFILLYYDFYLFLLYMGLTIIAVSWSLFWLKKRKVIDYQLFMAKAKNQEAVYEFYNGIKEMKLNQYEDYKKNEWIDLQKHILKINIKSLRVEQFQSVGFTFFNQLKNIFATFLSAYYVITETMTLGALLSVSFIIGQMNSPIYQLLIFIKSQQDALLSFNRLSEVYTQNEEENTNEKKLTIVKKAPDIHLKKVDFKYNIFSRKYVLNNINLRIPSGKTTAIVGHSGSGKTTLMKLLLKFFSPLSGDIFFGSSDINELSAKSIRENMGIVMQDGYIFSDTIERNIALNDTCVNKKRLYDVFKAVNLLEYINSLALRELTKIGAGGNDISGGQKQKILIARAIYKLPQYFFLDEATSALDATNEKDIHNNLQKLFKGKTVIIIAHRLSTVKKAHQIVVLGKGRIVEVGSHESLIKKKGAYFKLIKNQLNI